MGPNVIATLRLQYGRYTSDTYSSANVVHFLVCKYFLTIFVWLRRHSIWIAGAGSEAGSSGASAALAPGAGDGEAAGDPDGEDRPPPAIQSILTAR